MFHTPPKRQQQVFQFEIRYVKLPDVPNRSQA